MMSLPPSTANVSGSVPGVRPNLIANGFRNDDLTAFGEWLPCHTLKYELIGMNYTV